MSNPARVQQGRESWITWKRRVARRLYAEKAIRERIKARELVKQEDMKRRMKPQ